MKSQKTLCALCIALLFASGCAAPGGHETESGNNTALRCAALGAGGALLGAIMSGRDGALKGAAVGLAACAVIEVVSRQTKTSDQVEQQYKTDHRNRLPAEARIDAYETTVTPGTAIEAGDAVKLQSKIRVIAGTGEPVREVKEVLVAFAPNGEEFKRGEKKVNAEPGSGEYVNSFTLTLPQGAPQGMYKLQTQVFLNGRMTSKRDTGIQVADVGSPPQMALMVR